MIFLTYKEKTAKPGASGEMSSVATMSDRRVESAGAGDGPSSKIGAPVGKVKDELVKCVA